MTISKEEQARNHRRRRRQLWGVLICIFVLIGVGTVVKSAKDGLVALFDQSDEYELYENRLEGLVMFDPLPFDSIQNMNDITLRSAAVWGTVYDILDTEYGLTTYTRDDATDMALIPAVEVDAYLARLLGPSFKLDHHSFEIDGDMYMQYDEARQSYLIPVTSMVGAYTPRVVDIFKRAGLLYVTVGYMPSTDEVDLTTTVSDEPVKYMDYIFSSTGGNWYLTAMQPSEKQPEVQPTAEPTATPQAETEAEQAIIAGVTGEDVPDVQPSAAPSTDPAAEPVPEDDATEDAGEAPTAEPAA